MTASASPASWSRDLLLLALGLGAVFGFRLGSHPLINPDEGRYAEIPREMVATGDWVTPRLDGVKYFEKPPLMYWAVALCLEVFGPGEWSVRAPPALFALGGVLCTYAAGRRLYGRAAGLLAAAGARQLVALLRAGAPPHPRHGRVGADERDAFLLHPRRARAARRIGAARRRWLFYGLYASAALATLAKGLIGFLVTGGGDVPLAAALQPVEAAAAVLPADRRAVVPGRGGALAHPGGRCATPPGRIVSPLRTLRPLHVAGGQPARGRGGFLSRSCCWDCFRGRGFCGRGCAEALPRRLGGGAAKNADAWFFVTWAAFIFLFFSLSQSKLSAYILPVFPAPGRAHRRGGWRRRSDEGAARLRAGLGVFSFVCGLLAVALLVAVLKVGASSANRARRRCCGLMRSAWRRCCCSAASWHPGSRTSAARARALLGLAATMALFCGVLTFAAPNIQRPGTKELALFVKARAQPGDRVMHYHEFFHDFTFYAGRVVDVVAFKGELELEEDAAARASGRFLDEAAFRRLWTQPGPHLRRRAQAGREGTLRRPGVPVIICSARPRTIISSATSPDMSASTPPTLTSAASFLPFARPTIDEETIAGVAEVLRSGWITSGPQVKAFEAKLSEYCGGRPVRAFNSGTVHDGDRAAHRRRRPRPRGHHDAADVGGDQQRRPRGRRPAGLRRHRSGDPQPRPRPRRGGDHARHARHHPGRPRRPAGGPRPALRHREAAPAARRRGCRPGLRQHLAAAGASARSAISSPSASTPTRTSRPPRAAAWCSTTSARRSSPSNTGCRAWCGPATTAWRSSWSAANST